MAHNQPSHPPFDRTACSKIRRLPPFSTVPCGYVKKVFHRKKGEQKRHENTVPPTRPFPLNGLAPAMSLSVLHQQQNGGRLNGPASRLSGPSKPTALGPGVRWGLSRCAFLFSPFFFVKQFFRWRRRKDQNRNLCRPFRLNAIRSAPLCFLVLSSFSRGVTMRGVQPLRLIAIVSLSDVHRAMLSGITG